MEGYIGEVRTFAGTFAPVNWLFCQGQLLSIAQYDVLYTLLGTIYGGDGSSTFALPNLSSRIPVGAGQGPGLTRYIAGQTGGSEMVTLTVQQMPTHTHAIAGSSVSIPVMASNAKGDVAIPTNASLAAEVDNLGNDVLGFNPSTPTVPLHASTLSGFSFANSASGGSQAHENLQPSLVLNYIICFQGIYPSQP